MGFYLALILSGTLPATGADLSAPLRALLITGGCCHDYDNQKLILSQGISARANVTWTIVHEGGIDSNHKVSLYSISNWAAGYDIVVHNECFAGVTDNPFINGIAAAHSNGVPAVMLHCSIHSYRDATTDEWRKCLGITSYGHEITRNIGMTNVFPTHPVMRGFPTNWTDPNDELYISEVIWPNSIPLARARDPDRPTTNQVVIWVNTYGSGRIFGTTLGHDNATVTNNIYLDLITRGLLWACGRLDTVADLRVTAIMKSTTNNIVRWQSVPGWSYTLDSATNAGGSWTPLTNSRITASNVTSAMAITNFAVLDEPRRFFRVRLNDP